MLLFELYNVTKETLKDYNALCNNMKRPIVMILYSVVVYISIDILFYIVSKPNAQSISSPFNLYHGTSIWTTVTVKIIMECFFYTLFLTSWSHMFEMSSLQTKLNCIKKIKNAYTSTKKKCCQLNWVYVMNQLQIGVSHNLHLPAFTFLWCIWTGFHVSYLNVCIHLYLWYKMVNNLRVHFVCIPADYRIEGRHIYKSSNTKVSNVSAIIKWEYMDCKNDEQSALVSDAYADADAGEGEDEDWNILNLS